MNNTYLDNPQARPDEIKKEVCFSNKSRILLIGMGADIGSNILYLSATTNVEFPVTDVLTRHIESEGLGVADRDPLDELKARILLANPQLFGRITTNRRDCSLAIDNRSFRVHFRDLDQDITDLGHFDLAILATSRRHIRSQSYLRKIESIAKVVVGVAENSDLPALYPALINADPQHFHTSSVDSSDDISGSYAMGSCQCVGWTTGLRILADCCSYRGVSLQEFLIHSEVDIVHPDTASSNFGTKRIGSRTEDPRDNLRPGVSQVAESMLRFAPATSSNTVSLRVLTQPPGYQIQRFFLQGLDISVQELLNAARALESKEPSLIHVTTNSIGSRAYSDLPSGFILLATEHHLSIKRIGDITEVVLQAFVHNTLGYCATILSAVDHILSREALTLINSHNSSLIKEKI